MNLSHDQMGQEQIEKYDPPHARDMWKNQRNLNQETEHEFEAERQEV